MMHKDPMPKAQAVIKFLKYSLDEALRAFKIPDDTFSTTDCR